MNEELITKITGLNESLQVEKYGNYRAFHAEVMKLTQPQPTDEQKPEQDDIDAEAGVPETSTETAPEPAEGEPTEPGGSEDDQL